MPKREGVSETTRVPRRPVPEPVMLNHNKHSSLVDLSYLPDVYRAKINEIFDGYFSLGMKKSNWDNVEDNTPQFPSKLATLTSPDLGNILGRYTAWYSFASDKLKYIAVAHNFIDQELNKELERALGGLVADKGNIEAKKAKAKSSPDYILVYTYIQKLRGIKTLLEMELGNYDRCISTLSREISRREVNAGF